MDSRDQSLDGIGREAIGHELSDGQSVDGAQGVSEMGVAEPRIVIAGQASQVGAGWQGAGRHDHDPRTDSSATAASSRSLEIKVATGEASRGPGGAPMGATLIPS